MRLSYGNFGLPRYTEIGSPRNRAMDHHDSQALKTIRNEIRETLNDSVRRPRVVTDHERLEDISLKLARTLNTIEQQISQIEAR